MPTLVLLRHGQSQWNLENRFTGWWDVNLTEQGEAEATAAGELLQARGYDFDLTFTSFQTRAIKTLHLALEAMGRLWLPEVKDWRLNERHYGGLTGLNKAETAAKHGDEQVHIWRRSFDTPPPELAAGQDYDPAVDHRYGGVDVPRTESLKDTIARVLPYWEGTIVPEIRAGKRVLISAHGNSAARVGEAPVGDQRRGHRRAGDPHRPADGVRAGRRPDRHRPLLPQGPVSRPKDRQAREAEWLRLTREVMPGLARERGWPVRLDHCFQRILLDAELGSPWTERLTGRPAYKSVSDEALASLVARAEAVVAGDADLHALNRASLAGRGKRRD